MRLFATVDCYAGFSLLLARTFHTLRWLLLFVRVPRPLRLVLDCAFTVCGCVTLWFCLRLRFFFTFSCYHSTPHYLALPPPDALRVACLTSFVQRDYLPLYDYGWHGLPLPHRCAFYAGLYRRYAFSHSSVPR